MGNYRTDAKGKNKFGSPSVLYMGNITSFGCSNKFYPTSKREFTPIGVSYGLIWEKKSELTDLLGKYDYLALNFVCFSPWWIGHITFGHVAKMV